MDEKNLQILIQLSKNDKQADRIIKKKLTRIWFYKKNLNRMNN